MEAMTNGGLQPVYNVNGDGDSWGGGGSWWAIMLFFLLAWGGGWGGNRNQEALTRADLCQGFNFNNLDSAVRGVQSGLCDGFYAMNTGMLNGFGSSIRTSMNPGSHPSNAAVRPIATSTQ